MGWRQNRDGRASLQEMRPSLGAVPWKQAQGGREGTQALWSVGAAGDLATPPFTVPLFIHKLRFSKPEKDKYCMIPPNARSLESANP